MLSEFLEFCALRKSRAFLLPVQNENNTSAFFSEINLELFSPKSGTCVNKSEKTRMNLKNQITVCLLSQT